MFSNPKNNLDRFGIDPGIKVADLGAGAGNYSLVLSEMVGSTGRVYAVDIVQDLLTKLKNQAVANKVTNIEVIWGDIEHPLGTRLEDKLVDRAVIANTLFQSEDKDGLAQEAYRVLKDNGKLLVVDWTDSFGGLGPQKMHLVTEDQARAIFEKNNFTFEKKIDAGEHHYGLVFKKK